MRIGEAFPSNYLKFSDCEPDITLTITNCTMDELGQGAEKETKPVLHFKETDKGLVLNKTNANTIQEVLKSDDTDNWIGKRITLGAAEVEYAGRVMMGIRVRLRVAGGSSPAPTQQQAAADPAVKSSAWAAFQATLKPGTPTADAMVLLQEIIDVIYPGKTAKELNTQQWLRLQQAGFKPISNPLELETAGVPVSDIPF